MANSTISYADVARATSTSGKSAPPDQESTFSFHLLLFPPSTSRGNIPTAHGSAEVGDCSVNDRFLEASMLPNVTHEQRLYKYSRLNSIHKDFISDSTSYAKTIISEYFLPDEQKTLRPSSLGGAAGGQKFLLRGIVFKFANASGNPIYEHNDEAASKAAGHALKGANSYQRCHIPNLHIPLQVVVDHLGFRMHCSSKLPVNSNTLMVGTNNQGYTLKNEDSFLQKKLKKAAESLNLRAHIVKGQLLHTACDIEGHKGLDKRYYLIDLARSFPAECPSSTVHLWQPGYRIKDIVCAKHPITGNFTPATVEAKLRVMTSKSPNKSQRSQENNDMDTRMDGCNDFIHKKESFIPPSPGIGDASNVNELLEYSYSVRFPGASFEVEDFEIYRNIPSLSIPHPPNVPPPPSSSTSSPPTQRQKTKSSMKDDSINVGDLVYVIDPTSREDNLNKSTSCKPQTSISYVQARVLRKTRVNSPLPTRMDGNANNANNNIGKKGEQTTFRYLVRLIQGPPVDGLSIKDLRPGHQSIFWRLLRPEFVKSRGKDIIGKYFDVAYYPPVALETNKTPIQPTTNIDDVGGSMDGYTAKPPHYQASYLSEPDDFQNYGYSYSHGYDPGYEYSSYIRGREDTEIAPNGEHVSDKQDYTEPLGPSAATNASTTGFKHFFQQSHDHYIDGAPYQYTAVWNMENYLKGGKFDESSGSDTFFHTGSGLFIKPKHLDVTNLDFFSPRHRGGSSTNLVLRQETSDTANDASSSYVASESNSNRSRIKQSSDDQKNDSILSLKLPSTHSDADTLSPQTSLIPPPISSTEPPALSPDAFSRFAVPSNPALSEFQERNIEVTQATLLLLHGLIPALAKELLFKGHPQHTVGISLVEFVHQHGLNLRHIGLLRFVFLQEIRKILSRSGDPNSFDGDCLLGLSSHESFSSSTASLTSMEEDYKHVGGGAKGGASGPGSGYKFSSTTPSSSNFNKLSLREKMQTWLAIQQELLGECILRSLKSLLKEMQRSFIRSQRTSSQHSQAQLIVAFLNLASGAHENTDTFWDIEVQLRMTEKFGWVSRLAIPACIRSWMNRFNVSLPFSWFENEMHSTGEKRYLLSLSSLCTVRLGGDSRFYNTLIPRLTDMVGVRLTKAALDSFKKYCQQWESGALSEDAQLYGGIRGPGIFSRVPSFQNEALFSASSQQSPWQTHARTPNHNITNSYANTPSSAGANRAGGETLGADFNTPGPFRFFLGDIQELVPVVKHLQQLDLDEGAIMLLAVSRVEIENGASSQTHGGHSLTQYSYTAGRERSTGGHSLYKEDAIATTGFIRRILQAAKKLLLRAHHSMPDDLKARSLLSDVELTEWVTIRRELQENISLTAEQRYSLTQLLDQSRNRYRNLESELLNTRCSHSKLSCRDDILGLRVRITRSKYNGLASSSGAVDENHQRPLNSVSRNQLREVPSLRLVSEDCEISLDLYSLTYFLEMKREAERSSSSSTAPFHFHFLPVIIDAEHAEKVLPLLCEELLRIDRTRYPTAGWGSTFPYNCPIRPDQGPVVSVSDWGSPPYFSPALPPHLPFKLPPFDAVVGFRIVKVIMRCAILMIIPPEVGDQKARDGGGLGIAGGMSEADYEKVYLTFSRIHHMLLYLSNQDDSWRELADKYVEEFLHNPHQRNKKHCKDLLEWLLNLTLSRYTWEDVREVYLFESMSRQVAYYRKRNNKEARNVREKEKGRRGGKEGGRKSGDKWGTNEDDISVVNSVVTEEDEDDDDDADSECNDDDMDEKEEDSSDYEGGNRQKKRDSDYLADDASSILSGTSASTSNRNSSSPATKLQTHLGRSLNRNHLENDYKELLCLHLDEFIPTSSSSHRNSPGNFSSQTSHPVSPYRLKHTFECSKRSCQLCMFYLFFLQIIAKKDAGGTGIDDSREADSDGRERGWSEGVGEEDENVSLRDEDDIHASFRHQQQRDNNNEDYQGSLKHFQHREKNAEMLEFYNSSLGRPTRIMGDVVRTAISSILDVDNYWDFLQRIGLTFYSPAMVSVLLRNAVRHAHSEGYIPQFDLERQCTGLKEVMKEEVCGVGDENGNKGVKKRVRVRECGKSGDLFDPHIREELPPCKPREQMTSEEIRQLEKEWEDATQQYWDRKDYSTLYHGWRKTVNMCQLRDGRREGRGEGRRERRNEGREAWRGGGNHGRKSGREDKRQQTRHPFPQNSSYKQGRFSDSNTSIPISASSSGMSSTRNHYNYTPNSSTARTGQLRQRAGQAYNVINEMLDVKRENSWQRVDSTSSGKGTERRGGRGFIRGNGNDNGGGRGRGRGAATDLNSNIQRASQPHASSQSNETMLNDDKDGDWQIPRDHRRKPFI